MFLGRWFWIVVDGFGCLQMFWVDSSGFQKLAVLVARVKLVVLNLKEVDKYGKFL